MKLLAAATRGTRELQRRAGASETAWIYRDKHAKRGQPNWFFARPVNGVVREGTAIHGPYATRALAEAAGALLTSELPR